MEDSCRREIIPSEDAPGVDSDERRFAQNLAALRTLQPDWADELAGIPLPKDAGRQRSRDGIWTYRWDGTRGRTGWLGGSSMPRVCAEALFGHPSSPTASVLLPGILTGWEPIILADRLHRCAAVFVCDDDLAQIKLAMHAYDYRRLFAGHRLILAHRSCVRESLRRFFERHPGFEFPRRLLRAPQIPAAVFDALQRDVEAVALEVQGLQQARSRQFLERPAACSNGCSDPPRVVAVAAGLEPVHCTWLAAIHRALPRLGWAGTALSAADPAARHIVAFHAAVEAQHADWVLVVDGAAATWDALTPRTLATVAWLSASVGPQEAAALVGASRQLVFASTPAQFNALTAQAQRASLTEVLEPPIILDDETDQAEAPVDAASDVSVTVMAPNDAPDAAGISLPSHLALYQAMQRICLDCARSGVEPDASTVLAEAQRRCGLKLQDVTLRQQFELLITSRLRPAAWTRAVWDGLRRVGLRVSAWGPSALRLESPSDSKPRPASADAVPEAPRPRLRVWPLCRPEDAPALIEAAARGAQVLARRYAADLPSAHPMLHRLLGAVHWFDRPEEAVRLAQRLAMKGVGADPRRPDPAELARHSMEARLTHIHRRVAAHLEGQVRPAAGG